MMAAAAMDPITTGEGSKFAVVVGKRKPSPECEIDVVPEAEEPQDEEEITPAYYYENMGIPVFTPTMDQFRSFKHFVDKINHYGMQSGIIKVIPPKEWTDSLGSLDDKLKDVRIKNPIIQHMAGVAGEYRQENIEKQRTYNLPQWRQLCESSEHQPPAKRGERRKGQAVKEAPVGRKTRSKKVAAAATAIAIDDKDDEDPEDVGPISAARKRNPPTPKPPEKARLDEAGTPGATTESNGRQPRLSGAIESTPDPVTDSHGRQLRQRKKYVRKTAKEREAEQAILDDEAFEGFDFRIHNAADYTPERCDELEKAYWRTLTYSNPLYGADMPGSLFDDSTTSWNVAKLENLLDCLGKKLPGVNTAYLYLGMWRSTFAWHLEDVDLYSINYIHFGAPKQWYSVSRRDKEKFEQVMRGRSFPFRIWPNDSKKCSQFLRHKNYLVSPSLLSNHGIKVNKLVHHQGEFVITFPFGYHSGYNLGYNCAESVNFATESWLEFGRNAKKCECIKDSVWVDVDEIERKLRGESTEDEDEGEYYYYDEDDDELEAIDLPTPPESVEGKTPKSKSRPRKRKIEEGTEKPLKVKRLKLKFSREPAPEPCILCPNNIPYEELVATDDGQKAHRLCAIYTPETYFRWDEAQQRESIANAPGIPKARLELKCVFCRTKKGACFQCSAKKCTRAYHATCAAAAGVLVNMLDVPVYGEDGRIYTQTDIDFRCRFHRPKRPKDMDGDKLENDPLIREFASSLIKGDVIQMQYYKGEIFAGVIIENRWSEEIVVVNVLPKGETLEVEWKWILAQDPSVASHIPSPLTEMPLHPTAQQSGVPLMRARRAIPEPEDPFCDEGSGLRWGELAIGDNVSNLEDQLPFDPNNPIWYYLGELSTDYIAKYSDDPGKRIPNDAANIVSSRRSRTKIMRTPTKAMYSGQVMQYSTPSYPQGSQTYSLGQSYQAPVAHMMGEGGQVPPQQLWPPVYRPSAASPSPIGNGIVNIVTNATKAFISEQALSSIPSIEGQIVSVARPDSPAGQSPPQTNGGVRRKGDDRSSQDGVQPSSSVSVIDPQLMVQSNAPAIAQPLPPSLTHQSPPPLHATPATAPNHQLVPVQKAAVPAAPPITKLRETSVPTDIARPSTPPPSSLPQYTPPASLLRQQSLSPASPRKPVPLADIQAALAQLAKARAEEEAQKRASQAAAAVTATHGQTTAPPPLA